MPCDHINILQLLSDNKAQEAHKLVQNHADELACLIHAYIHRAEDDLSNAKYWYKKAGIDKPDISLNEEYKMLLKMAQSAK